jgi:signal transduction histidine kinase
MPNGGAIATHISWTPSEEWMVEIQDTGMGIPAYQLPHLFDPFFTTKSSQQGRGLGLWVTRGILEIHGGRIEIESQEFEGTTCRIFLPGRGKHHEGDGRR